MTLRRLLVFGVCAVGVSALYTAPTLTRSPQPTAGPAPVEEPTLRASRSPGVRTAGPASASTSRPTADPTSARSEQTGPAPGATALQPSATRAPRRGATPFDPARGAGDRVAPSPVRAIVTASVTEDRLTLTWPPATDDVAVTGYRVWLDGFEVATTTRNRATVRWFNDDAEEHVVQVRAMDAAGNESESSPTVLVTRPTPQPDESPTTPVPSSPSPAPTPEATAAPRPSASPSTASPSTASPSAPAPSRPVPPASTPDGDELVRTPRPSTSGSVR